MQLSALRLLLFGLVTALPLSSTLSHAAESPMAASANIGNDGGKFRFELHKLGKGKYERFNEVDAEIKVFKNESTEVFQRIKTIIGIESPAFDFIDINGDGYVDMLLYNACAGYADCSGPSTGADVFVYAPQLGKYVKSKTLSGKGNITTSKKKGCINVNYKCSDQDYIDEEWCFNLSTGKWKMIKQSACN